MSEIPSQLGALARIEGQLPRERNSGDGGSSRQRPARQRPTKPVPASTSAAVRPAVRSEAADSDTEENPDHKLHQLDTLA